MKISLVYIYFILTIMCLVTGVFISSFILSNIVEEGVKDISISYAKTISEIYVQNSTLNANMDSNMNMDSNLFLDYVDEDTVVFISDKNGRVLNSNYQGIRKNEKLPLEILNAQSFETSIKGNSYTLYGYSSNQPFIVFVGFNTNTQLKWTYDMIVISIITALLLVLVLSLVHRKFFSNPIKKLHDFARNIVEDRSVEEINLYKSGEMGILSQELLEIDSKLKGYNDAQKAFLQNISHEMKTPLMSIQSYSEGILDGIIEKEEMNESLKLIISESNRLKNLVNELIFYGKLQSSTFMFDFKLCNLKDIIIDSIESVGGLAIKKGINFDYSPRSVFLKLDEDKMKQALMNIFSNCIRHGRKLICVNVVENSNNLEITISDDGEGFTEDDLQNLFNRFAMGKKGESGLGLSITKSIIDKHRGNIMVENGAHGGALFKVILNK